MSPRSGAPGRSPGGRRAALRRASLAALVAAMSAASPAAGGAPPPVVVEPAGPALARIDSLMAVVREEEERVRAAPAVEGSWTRLARAWFQVGNHQEAAQCVERARRLGAREFETSLLAGRVARSEGRFAEAIEWLERATRARNEDWEVHEDLGLALYLDGRLARAADHWTRARTLPGSASPDRAGLTDALRRAGDGAYRLTGTGRERLRFVARSRRGPLVVPVRLAGRGPYLFRIDPGSPEVTIQASLARELELETFPGSRTGSPAASVGIELDYAFVDSLTLGGTTLHRLPVAVTATGSLGGDPEVRGLLGFEALRRFFFCIDLPDSTLWLDPLPAPGPAAERRPTWAPEGAVAHRVPLLLRGTHLLIARGRLDGGPERPFLLDAGGTGIALLAPRSTLAEANIAPDSARVRTGTGASGGVAYLGFPIARLCVGDACRDSLEGAYGLFPPRLELNPNFRVAGIVSGGFLARYRVGVNLAACEGWLVEP